jgi:hypothetical protein
MQKVYLTSRWMNHEVGEVLDLQNGVAEVLVRQKKAKPLDEEKEAPLKKIKTTRRDPKSILTR